MVGHYPGQPHPSQAFPQPSHENTVHSAKPPAGRHGAATTQGNPPAYVPQKAPQAPYVQGIQPGPQTDPSQQASSRKYPQQFIPQAGQQSGAPGKHQYPPQGPYIPPGAQHTAQGQSPQAGPQTITQGGAQGQFTPPMYQQQGPSGAHMAAEYATQPVHPQYPQHVKPSAHPPNQNKPAHAQNEVMNRGVLGQGAELSTPQHISQYANHAQPKQDIVGHYPSSVHQATQNSPPSHPSQTQTYPVSPYDPSAPSLGPSPLSMSKDTSPGVPNTPNSGQQQLQGQHLQPPQAPVQHQQTMQQHHFQPNQPLKPQHQQKKQHAQQPATSQGTPHYEHYPNQYHHPVPQRGHPSLGSKHPPPSVPQHPSTVGSRPLGSSTHPIYHPGHPLPQSGPPAFHGAQQHHFSPSNPHTMPPNKQPKFGHPYPQPPHQGGPVSETATAHFLNHVANIAPSTAVVPPQQHHVPGGTGPSSAVPAAATPPTTTPTPLPIVRTTTIPSATRFPSELQCYVHSDCELGCCYANDGTVLWDNMVYKSQGPRQVGHCYQKSRTNPGDSCHDIYCPCQSNQHCISVPSENSTVASGGGEAAEAGIIGNPKCYNQHQFHQIGTWLLKLQTILESCRWDPHCGSLLAAPVS